LINFPELRIPGWCRLNADRRRRPPARAGGRQRASGRPYAARPL